MGKYKLKILVLITCYLFSNNVFCIEIDENRQLLDTNLCFSKYCHDNAPILEEYLQPLDKAELHFFWTSGRDPEILKQQGLKPQIQIGGSAYADQFPIALESLLQYSPANLTIYLVLDSVTQQSNQIWLKSIQNRYLSRFQILDIDTVTDNIVKAFPKYDNTIKTVFANATRGNPAIASDIYRLIGMMYGQNSVVTEFNRKQYTYCDVDTFCYGLQHQDHAKLMSALLAESPQWSADSLHLSKRANEYNDVIKLQVSNKSLPLYDKFCQDILDHLEQTLQSQDITILNYFPKLKDSMANNDEFVKDYLSKFGSSRVSTNDIFNITGPQFLQTLHSFTIMDDFPLTVSLQWHMAYHLTKPMFRWGAPVELKDSRALSNFEIILSQYVHTITDALYLRRCYDENLPAYKQLIQFLAKKENFPFTRPEFKEVFEEAYRNYDQGVTKADTYYEDGTTHKEIFTDICQEIGAFYLTPDCPNSHAYFLPNLKSHLKDLKITDNFLTEEDLENLKSED